MNKVFNSFDSQLNTGCTCQKCGVKYKVDFNIDDNLWIKIRPTKLSKEGWAIVRQMYCGSNENIGDYNYYKIEGYK